MMEKVISQTKLKIPFMIKKPRKLIFVKKQRGFEIPNATDEMIDFIKQLFNGINSNDLALYLEKNNRVSALYGWLKKKDCISTNVINCIVNTENEKNYEYISSLDKNPHKLLKKIKESHVAIVGCGGTGSIVVQNLVAMGFRRLSVIDYDKIEYSNLNRQIVYSYSDVGKYKAEVLANKLKLLHREVKVTSHIKKIQNEKDLIEIYDNNLPAFMVCGIDTPPILSRINVLKFCELHDIPSIFGGVGIETGNYGPLIDNEKDRKLYQSSLNNIKSQYKVDGINLIKGSLCPTNSIISSFMALDIFKWFTNTNPLSYNKISNVDFSLGIMKHNNFNLLSSIDI